MNPEPWSLEAALRFVKAHENEEPDVAVDQAYAAIIQLGYRAGAASGNPVSFLRDFFHTEIKPRLEHDKKWLLATIGTTVAHMRAEGFAGPISQTVFAHAVLGDVLVKLTAQQPGLNWASLSTPEWVYIAICAFLWLKGDQSGAVKTLLADIEKAMDE